MSASWLGNVLALLVLPLLLTGWIQRVKALWSGRKGWPLLQPAYDVLKLLRKSPVYSTTSTPIFHMAPWIRLVTTVGPALLVPLAGGPPLLSFAFDFIWLAYVWALGRVALLLAALDTGSSFEGMGAAREATFSTLLEPVFLLTVAALSLGSGTHTLHEALRLGASGSPLLLICALVALLIVLQVEAARMPVDDPTTHLELTMVHEVMVLDHSGPELAAIQLASALQLFVGTAMVATLLNPWAASGGLLAAAAQLLLCLLVGLAVGTVESLVARLKLRRVPSYIAVAFGAAAVALLLGAWGAGSP